MYFCEDSICVEGSVFVYSNELKVLLFIFLFKKKIINKKITKKK